MTSRISYKSKSIPQLRLVILDAIGMCFTLIPVLFAWGLALSYLRYIWLLDGFLLRIGALPLILMASFLCAMGTLRSCLPELKPGIYPIGLNRDFLNWYIHLCMGHAARIAGLQWLFSVFYTTKYFYWRVMGAKIAYGVNSSATATITDLPLIRIGKGCTLGMGSVVLGHIFVGDTVLLGNVDIGDNVFVGAFSMIGPKTVIGNGTWIGMNNRLMSEEIPENSRFANFARPDFSRPQEQL